MAGKENSKRQEETSLNGESLETRELQSLLLDFLVSQSYFQEPQINIWMDVLQLCKVCAAPRPPSHRTTENKGMPQEVGG